MTELKIIIVGESGTGKSSLIKKYLKDKTSPEQTTTIRQIETKINNVKVTILDTPGTPTQRKTIAKALEGADIIIITYCDKATLNRWEDIIPPQATVQLIFTKLDLACGDKLESSMETWRIGAALAKRKKWMHCATSTVDERERLHFQFLEVKSIFESIVNTASKNERQIPEAMEEIKYWKEEEQRKEKKTLKKVIERFFSAIKKLFWSSK